ncbi:MAG: (2Fe-2S)-binding protein [Thermoplasmatota archaeon]
MTTPKVIICACEDISIDEVEDAIHEGYDDMETLKRFTGVATGPCQGKSCVVLCRRLLAEVPGGDPAEIGTITFRPPTAPLPLRYLAGEEVP